MRDYILVGMVALLLPLVIVRPFVGVLLWSWIAFMNPHRLGWGVATTMPLATIAFSVTMIGWLLGRESKRLPINGVTTFLVLFFGYATLTSYTALAQPSVVWTQWESLLKVILGLFLTASLLTDRWRVHALVWLMVLSIGYFGIKGGLFTLISGGSSIVLGPPDTIIGDRNHLAVALLVTLPLMNYLRLQSAFRSVRIGLLVSMGLVLIAVLGSQSRGALVALVATLLVLWIRSRARILPGLIIIGALAMGIHFMPESWTERMRSIETYEEDRSAMGRIDIWHSAIAIVRDRPLVGGGFRAVYDQDIVDQYTPGTRARADHSIWFEALGGHGIPGFLIWLSILVAGGLYTFRIIRLARGVPELRWASDLARMSQISIVAYCVGGTFLSLAYWDMFWALMVMLGATHALVRQAVGREQIPEGPARHGIEAGRGLQAWLVAGRGQEMNTAYFLVMLVAVGWLMVWAAIPPSYRVGRRFWPYDMVSDATAQKDGTPTGDGSGHAAGPADGPAPHSTWRQRAAAAHRGPQATDTRPAGR